MALLGLVLLILGLIFGFSLLVVIGIVLLIVGLVYAVVGRRSGRPMIW